MTNPNKAELRRLAEALPKNCSPYTRAYAEFRDKANPAAVLSLLDECELLRHGAKGDFDLDAWLEWAKEAQALRTQNAGLITQHGRDSVELSKQCHARDVARKERDKAEAERDAALAELERAYANYNQVSYASTERGKQIETLRAELEACRKDAELYRWVSSGVQEAETLVSVVLCHGGDAAKIAERIATYMEANQEVRHD